MLAGENTMRLICPNCGAQYEIDAGLIPPAGRDVQCSNCGNTWFQAGKLPESTAEQRQIEDREHDPDYEPGGEGAAPEAASDSAASESAASTPAADGASGAKAPNEAVAEIVGEAEEQVLEESIAAQGSKMKFETLAAKLSQPRKELPAEAETETETAAGTGDGPRKILAADVAEVLREEAERETRKRHHEAVSLETQGELGISDIGARDDKVTHAAVAQEHTSGRAEAATAKSAWHAGSRRDDLPDIEKITSTLRANSEHAQPGGPTAAAQSVVALERRRGFQIGFLLVVIVAAALLGAYDYAPQIARQVPAARPSLTNYVAKINQGRVWLDNTFNAALGALTYRAGKPGG